MNLKKTALWLLVIMVVSFTIAGATLGDIIFSHDKWQDTNALTLNEEKVFAVSDIKDITIGATSANIDVLTSEDDDIKVKMEASYSSSSSAPELRAVVREGVLDIEINHKPAIGVNVIMNEKLTVYVPSSYEENLKVHAVSGNVNVKGLHLNELELSSTSGNIITEGVTANTTKAGSVSGNTRLFDFAGDLKGSSTSGSLWVEYKEYEENRVNFKAVSGEIYINIPDDAGFRLEANSVSGDIKCSFPVTIEDNSRGHIAGEVNGGGGEIVCKTTSGDIEIR